MFNKRSKATSAVMAGLLAVGMAASPLAPAVALAANSASTGSQTGSGQTDLTMILKDTDEHGGTAEPEFLEDGVTPNPLYNPDADGDGLGDNLAFTVPTAINYVVDADGTMTGPTNATIQNRSVMGINVSSVDVDEQTPFKIVSDATASTDTNSVDLQFGPAADQLNAADYLTKTDVADASKWEMGAEGAADANLGIQTDGHVSHVAQDITKQSKFGTIKWYLKATEQATKSNTLVAGHSFHSSILNAIGGWDNRDKLTSLVVAKGAPDTVNGTLVSDDSGGFPVYFTLDEATGVGTLTSEADKIVLNEDCTEMFGNSSLTSIDASAFDTSGVTNMDGMFFRCTDLTLDCSGWDVSNVTSYEDFNSDAPGVILPNWVHAMTWDAGEVPGTVTAALYSNGTLVVSGTGAMKDYSGVGHPSSWSDWATSVVVEDGVTSIGNAAFSNCPFLTTATIPSSVTSIGEWAFENCNNLTTINCGFYARDVSGAPWGASNATVNYAG